MIRLLLRGGLISTILVIVIAYAYWDYVLYVVLGLPMVFVLKKIVWLIRKIHTRNQDLRLQDVDSMDGISFEHYIAQLLAERGYSNVSLTEQYDYGVDIIAEKDGVCWGIQTKRYSGLVKAEAVRQVVTGLRLYGCDRAMVVTNSTYSNVAKRLAEGNDCVLIDRDGLADLAN
jgi:restriction system protein